MANWLEKRLPAPIRTTITAMIGAALGLFLALRYNDYITKIMLKILPGADNLVIEGIILLGVTILIIFLQTAVTKGLDGK